MQEFALLSVWPREDGIIAVQLRLRAHQAAAQHWAFLFAACKKPNPGSEAHTFLGFSQALVPFSQPEEKQRDRERPRCLSRL